MPRQLVIVWDTIHGRGDNNFNLHTRTWIAMSIVMDWFFESRCPTRECGRMSPPHVMGFMGIFCCMTLPCAVLLEFTCAQIEVGGGESLAVMAS